MGKLIKCAFNMDTACVELCFSDGTQIAIDTTAVEDETCHTIAQVTDLQWLMYNKPLEYAQLVLEGDLNQYLKGPAEHGLEEQPNLSCWP